MYVKKGIAGHIRAEWNPVAPKIRIALPLTNVPQSGALITGAHTFLWTRVPAAKGMSSLRIFPKGEAVS
jgi:hypothetical protein